MARHPPSSSRADATIGVSDHGGWAVLVTVAGDGTVLDRRRVTLVDEDLPALPHHHEGQHLPIEEAVQLVERVRVSAGRHAERALDDVARAVPRSITGIALRECPRLPATVAERLTDYRARNTADWVMYRMALVGAAEARHWAVHWYDAKRVLEAADVAPGGADLESYFQRVRRSLGPPWNRDHRLATAAALVAARP
jgi:hypothetical protein